MDRPHTLPVVLCVDEIPPASGRQDPDAETAEFRVADFTNGLAGFECVDQTLGQAAVGHGFSPESVALANRNAADWPIPVLDTREKSSLIQTFAVSSAPKVRTRVYGKRPFS